MSGGKTNGVFRLAPKTERVELDGDFAGLWVEMLVTVSQADMKHWEGEQGGITGLAAVVKAWNLADADGTPLPISSETLQQVPLRLIRTLSDAFREHALGVPKATAAS